MAAPVLKLEVLVSRDFLISQRVLPPNAKYRPPKLVQTAILENGRVTEIQIRNPNRRKNTQ